jgi:hypothetical protein
MTRRAVPSLESRHDPVAYLLAAVVLCAVCMVGSVNAHTSNSSAEQALIITIPFTGKTPSNEEVQRLYKLEDELIKQIEHSRVGEYDGDEIGDTTFTMYAYGPSADRLFDVALPILVKYRLPAGSRAVKRFGKPGAREERVPVANGAAN